MVLVSSLPIISNQETWYKTEDLCKAVIFLGLHLS
jgi:hypothetical protein